MLGGEGGWFTAVAVIVVQFDTDEANGNYADQCPHESSEKTLHIHLLIGLSQPSSVYIMRKAIFTVEGHAKAKNQDKQGRQKEDRRQVLLLSLR